MFLKAWDATINHIEDDKTRCKMQEKLLHDVWYEIGEDGKV
jgi:hypothetical protein